jgi:hypothetical protein
MRKRTVKPCSAPECDRTARGSLCWYHSAIKLGNYCTVCGQPAIAKKLCGTHVTEQWRIDNAEKFTHTCVTCGEEFKTWRKVMASCTLLCQRRNAAATRETYTWKPKTTELASYLKPRIWLGSTVPGRSWSSGPCGSCGEQFTGPKGSRYCSDTCANRVKWQRKIERVGDFSISDRVRRAIYARDGNTCQLCFTQVDMKLHYNDRMSATLDHIIPQSHDSGPDHSPLNLRLSHRLCNSQRGNRVDSIQFELIAG